MGLNFRKSIRVGKYFKINISKSGIGYSAGVKGARVTVGAKGRTTATIGVPGTGISYTQTIGGKRKKNSTNNKYNTAPSNFNTDYTDEGIAVESADITNFQPAEKQEIFNSIKLCKNINLLGIIAAIAGFIFSAQLSNGDILKGVLGIIALIGGLVGIIYARFILPVNLDYDIDSDTLYKHQQLLSAWNQMNSSIMKWQITSFSNVTQTKTHAGANRSLSRVAFSILNKLPYYIKTNAPFLTIKLKNEELILLPEQILIIRGSKVGAVEYKDIICEVATSRFVEEERVFGDSEIIDYTWKYVNKNGGPDKRFNDNRQLPICKYGNLKITSYNGLNVWLQCSDWRKISHFEALYGR